MSSALFGWSGFVGSHLKRQRPFTATFNSRTIDQSSGEAFELAVCAASPGSMFEANKFPDRDKARVDALMASLSEIRVENFVLISTIAVLAEFDGRDDELTNRYQDVLAYGRHRRLLEAFCQDRFERCLIVRLPALFGTGLQKNFVFDILNPMPSMVTGAGLEDLRAGLPTDLSERLDDLYRRDEALNMAVLDREALQSTGQREAFDAGVVEAGLSAARFTHPESRFQYYAMSGLWQDVTRGLDHGLDVLHLATEPLEAGRVYRTLTGRVMADAGARIHREDMRTRHADLWGRPPPHIAAADDVLEALKVFYASERLGR